MRNKLHAKKVTMGGETYASKKEYHRWCELKLLEKAGKISDLEKQVPFVLIGEQREYCNEIYTRGKHKGCFKPGKLIERPCVYIADFVYKDEDGKLVVEDAKGMRDTSNAIYQLFVVKRKLMLERYGIKIKEV